VKYNIGDLLILPCICLNGYIVKSNKLGVVIREFHTQDKYSYSKRKLEHFLSYQDSQHFSINKEV
jgi:hypothetical protein